MSAPKFSRPLLVGLAALAGSCTFIIQPPTPPAPPTYVAPFTCLPVAVDPASGEQNLIEEDVPKVQVLFASRLERSTTTLVSTYAQAMREVVLGLSALGAHVTVAALTRLDERPIERPVLAAWGCGLEDPNTLTPEAVLMHYAVNSDLPAEPAGCALDPVIDAGERLNALVTDYPPALNGRSGRSVFGEAPDLFLVVYLDSLARRSGQDDPECARASRLADVDESGRAGWLNFGGADLPADRVGHWFVYTDEEVDDARMGQRCRSIEGFDLTLFDALEASPRALYGPTSRPLVGRGAATKLPMCELLVESKRQAFLLGGLKAVGSKLGLDLRPELLEALLLGPLEPVPEDDSGGT